MGIEAIPRSALSRDVLKRITRLGRADILVGIPSFRNASTISHVVRVAAEGMTKYFPELRPVLVNSDGGSKDRTRDVVLETPVPQGVDKIVTPYLGPVGKGSAFKTIFEIADRLKVKVAVVVDSDLRSITPEWIKLLGEPIYRHSFGFVTPYYVRYKYDGTITNSLAYPLTRALYGHDIRQPIGGDFGLTGALNKILSHQRIWETQYIKKFGIDIWMTTTAINEGFRVAQAGMGVKLHDPKDPSASLGPMFREVVGTMFSLMREYEVKWKIVRGSQTTDLFGEVSAAEPQPVSVDLNKLITNFREGFKTQRKNVKMILAPENLKKVSELTHPPGGVFDYPDTLWARTVYDFAVAYNFSDLGGAEVVDALIPLYFARTASFVIETEVMSNTEAEEAVQILAHRFEGEKPYLIERWEEAKRRWELAGATCPVPWCDEGKRMREQRRSLRDEDSQAEELRPRRESSV